MKTRHKINWENVADALDRLGVSYDLDALEVLRAELLPKYEAVKARRAYYREAVAAYRREHGRPEDKARVAAYSKEYRETHREQVRETCRKSQQKRRARIKAEQDATTSTVR